MNWIKLGLFKLFYISGFLVRFYGTCPPNCESCESDTVCNTCNLGYYGRNCSQCPEHCYRCSSDSNCSTCDTGYFGTTCTHNCSPGCKYNYCETVTAGKCRFGCRHNFSGSHCLECISGYHSETCTERCSPGCIDGVCLSNGKCTHGCKSDMYIGDTCCTKADTNCTTYVNTESGLGNVFYPLF